MLELSQAREEMHSLSDELEKINTVGDVFEGWPRSA